MTIFQRPIKVSPRLAETAIAEASRVERNRIWREENREAIEQYAWEIEEPGLPLTKYRTF